METDKKYKGIWKIGENTEEIKGDFFKENGKWILSFKFDYLDLNFILKELEGKNIEIINGELDNGEKITILNPEIENNYCFEGNKTLHSCYCESNIIIKGHCFDSVKKIVFKNIYVESKQIQKWLPDKTIKITKNENNKIYLEIKELEKENYVEFEFYKNFTYKEIISEIEDISKIFSLFIGERVYMGHRIKNKLEDIEILKYFTGYKYDFKEENKITVPYKYIKEDLNTIIKNWNNKKEKLLDIVNIFIELVSKPIVIPIEILFLLVLQGLESVSRRFRNLEEKENLEEKISELCNELPEKEKREFLKKILKSIDEEKLRDLFKVNEITFRKRLKELLKESKINLKGLNSKKKKKLRDDIIETRNYHTHLYDPKTNKILSDSYSYFYVMKYLEVVLYEFILKELGIDNEEVVKILTEKYSYAISRVVGIYS